MKINQTAMLPGPTSPNKKCKSPLCQYKRHLDELEKTKVSKRGGGRIDDKWKKY